MIAAMAQLLEDDSAKLGIRRYHLKPAWYMRRYEYRADCFDFIYIGPPTNIWRGHQVNAMIKGRRR